MQKFKKEVGSHKSEYEIPSPVLKKGTTNYTNSTDTFLVFEGEGRMFLHFDLSF
jgi:hypothetical protein